MKYDFIIETNDTVFDENYPNKRRPVQIVVRVEGDPQEIIKNSCKFGDEFVVIGSTAIPHYKTQKITWKEVKA